MLSEPTVLAQAKEFMMPDSGSSTADNVLYATVDTQFRKNSWPNVGPIDRETRDTLAPFNHISLGSGYPDMVVAGPPPEFLQPLQIAEDSLPVIAVEAKGETKKRSGTEVPASEALLQAHDRLSESNAALAVIPATAQTAKVRQLARELDIGLLTVSETDVSIVEPAVAKGIATNETAFAVRWQASAQRVADQSFHYNHPKTYLGVPLAMVAEADTGEIFQSTIAKEGFQSGKAGAKFLGLIQTAPAGGLRLTPLGKEAVRYAIRTHGSIDAALEEMATWGGRGSRTDLIDRHRGWGELTRSILFQYPATPFVVDTIDEATPSTAHGDDPTVGPVLPDLVKALYAKRPAYTVELFIRRNSEARKSVFEEDDSLSQDALTKTDVYQSTTVYQYKMMLRHSGILHPDVTANSTDALTPTTDRWTLRTTLNTNIGR